MAENKTISDLKVKGLIVQSRNGSSWGKIGTPIFQTNVDYRVSVIFGNTQGFIDWGSTLYDKENIRITLSQMGVKTSSRYILQDGLEFFGNSSFSGAPLKEPSPIFIEGPFKTYDADLGRHFYFRAKPVIEKYPIISYRFSVLISAAIRNQRSHQAVFEL
ncbi:MAG: hypothetical protein KDD01_13400 [Phaeodactylibacter sp.]|nr:hypothetical protein [Phaeodactylibacter sp.]MCB0615861.1 hypothetical protein [Phaeodactylibacter sp.]